MTQAEQMQAVEERAFAARHTMNQVCARAGVLQPAWSRAKRNGAISVRLLKRVEDAIAALEAERAQ